MASLLRLKFSLHRRLPSFHHLKSLPQFHFYSTQSADDPKEPPSNPASSQTTNNHSIQSSIWPRPKEIPYQSKVANYINLVGYVETPVQTQADSDGKHFSTIVISQKSSSSSRGKGNSLSVPVVFDGDLAHVVACHLKPKDRVLVSGRLSEEPQKFPLGDGFGKFHVVGEDVNFVEGFGRKVSSQKVEVSFTAVAGSEKTEKIELYKNVHKSTSFKNKNDEEWWNDLVKNPHQWWDYRGHKSNGLVKDRFPDFKQKIGVGSLWINSAPRWVSTELGGLEFDVKDMQGKQVKVDNGFGDGKVGKGKREDLWKDLVENPNGWWDNRLGKRNPKSPDFKHKESGEGVWLNDLPESVLSKLPPSRDGQLSSQPF